MNYDDRLKRICKRCLAINSYCIKDEPYIGLCAINDKDELIQIFKEKDKVRK